jgi:hypothetical protein
VVDKNAVKKRIWMKRVFLILGVVVILVILVLPVTPVLAESVNITVTARPLVTGGITDFIITYVSDYQLDFSWGYTGDATHIMIRGKYGDYPENITDPWTEPSDGWLVYYGDGTEATDWVNMEFLSVPIYYSAWAQKDDGMWYLDVQSGWKESALVLFLGFIFLALGLTALAYTKRRGELFFGSAGAWVILTAYSFSRMESTNDIYFYLFLFCAALVFVSAFGALATREKREAVEEEEDWEIEEREAREEGASYKRRRYSTMPSVRGKPRVHHRPSNFSRTGEM